MHFILAANKAFVIAANSELISTFCLSIFLRGFESFEYLSLIIVSSWIPIALLLKTFVFLTKLDTFKILL